MNFINMTPHPINILDEDNQVIVSLPKGETIPRLSQSTEIVDEVNGVSITETSFGKTQDLPEPNGDLYVVSRLVLAANPDRDDLVVPNQLVRDDNGSIIGCRSLARN